jgi:hypothetical protein
MFGPSPFPSQSTHLFSQYRIHHRFNPLPCAYSRASHHIQTPCRPKTLPTGGLQYARNTYTSFLNAVLLVPVIWFL